MAQHQAIQEGREQASYRSHDRLGNHYAWQCPKLRGTAGLAQGISGSEMATTSRASPRKATSLAGGNRIVSVGGKEKPLRDAVLFLLPFSALHGRSRARRLTR